MQYYFYNPKIIIFNYWGNILKKYILALPVLSLLFAGCAINGDLKLKSNGSGNAEFYFELEPYLMDFILNSDDTLGDDAVNENDFFKKDDITKKFGEIEAVKLNSLDSPGPNVLKGEIDFSDVSKVLESEDELQNAGVIRLEEKDGKKTFYLHLDRENYKELSVFSDIVDNPLFEMFGPESNKDISSDDEYYDILEYAIGAEGIEGLKKSYIILKVNVDKDVIDTNGVKNKNSVEFKIPLVRVLILDKPIDYFLTF